jgi:hypothetical protein
MIYWCAFPNVCVRCMVYVLILLLTSSIIVLCIMVLYHILRKIIRMDPGAILISFVIAYLLRLWNAHRIPLATVIRGASIVLVPSVTCGRGITPLRGHPCSHCWVLNLGCLCVDTTLDRIRPLSQPQTTILAMHMYHT